MKHNDWLSCTMCRKPTNISSELLKKILAIKKQNEEDLINQVVCDKCSTKTQHTHSKEVEPVGEDIIDESQEIDLDTVFDDEVFDECDSSILDIIKSRLVLHKNRNESSISLIEEIEENNMKIRDEEDYIVDEDSENECNCGENDCNCGNKNKGFYDKLNFDKNSHYFKL